LLGSTFITFIRVLSRSKMTKTSKNTKWILRVRTFITIRRTKIGKKDKRKKLVKNLRKKRD
jgi:hypothetical protein